MSMMQFFSIFTPINKDIYYCMYSFTHAATDLPYVPDDKTGTVEPKGKTSVQGLVIFHQKLEDSKKC